MTHETSALLERIRAGDVSAFEVVFRELHAPLCDFVYSVVRSQDIAEEIVQDLFFVLWQQRESLLIGSLRGYLFTAAKNRALHHTRHETFRERLARRFGLRADIAGVAQAAEPVDEALERDEQRAGLRHAIEQLPPRSRQAIELRWDHQLSHAEIATRMGISTKGVEKLLATGKRLLRPLVDARVRTASELQE